MRLLAIAALVLGCGCASLLGIDDWQGGGDAGATGGAGAATSSSGGAGGGGGTAGHGSGGCAQQRHFTFTVEDALDEGLAQYSSGLGFVVVSGGKATVEIDQSDAPASGTVYTIAHYDLSGCDVVIDFAQTVVAEKGLGFLRVTSEATLEQDLVELLYMDGTLRGYRVEDGAPTGITVPGQGASEMRMRLRFTDRAHLAVQPVGSGPGWIAVADWALPPFTNDAAIVFGGGRLAAGDAQAYAFDDLFIAGGIE